MNQNQNQNAYSLLDMGAAVAPILELVFEALIDVGDVEDLGDSPRGHRRRVEILGGSFRGSRISGMVLPGGSDRQLLRSDGIRELEATYELRAEDGAVISVVNRVIVEGVIASGGYARSVITLTAPKGPHDWLNRRVLVGTLEPLTPGIPAVIVRAYMVL